MYKFRKTLLFCILLIFAFTSLCFADQPPVAGESKISVIVFPHRIIRNNAEAMDIFTTAIYKQFDAKKYNIEIWGRGQQSFAFVELTEKVLNHENQVIMKEDCLAYAKATNSDYVISLLIFPTDYKFSPGLFSFSTKYAFEANLKGYDLSGDQYIYNQTFTTEKKDKLVPNVKWIMDKIQNELSLPEKIKK